MPSIEAARAGEAGRGFAVVADQIGKLAADSAKSAVNTRNLIGKTLEEIGRGSEITAKTQKAFNDVIADMKLFLTISKETSDTLNTQKFSLQQVQQAIELISQVVQNNSASAEENSATSEELFAQSENLKEQVNKFQLVS